MIVAITQRNDKNKHGDRIDNLENNYINYLEKFGITCIPVPNTSKNPASYLEKVDALILTGGNCVDPKLYDGKISEESDASSERDSTEKKLLDTAVKKKMPVLGICRGSQFINVYFGGSLVDVKLHFKGKINHVRVFHQVDIVGSEAQKALGPKSAVNSYHNHAIVAVPPKLKVFAQSPDGIIEGIYHPSLPIAGIQWHPERESPDIDLNKKLIQAFAKRELFWK